MNKEDYPKHSRPNTGRIWAGIIIVGIGTILLAGKLGLGWLFPQWIFNWGNMWPTILIVVGLITGGNANFRHPSAYIMIGIGSFFLLRNLTDINIGPFIWPTLIIGIGLWLLLGKRRPGPPPRGHDRRKRYHPHAYDWDKRVVNEQPDRPADSGASPIDPGDPVDPDPQPNPGKQPEDFAGFSNEDYLKSTSIFGDQKKTIISKRFKGGEVVNVFGGTDINLIQADIQHPVVIDVFQIFAGTKIIIPAHWKVHSDVVSVFGEVDDKRFTQGMPQDEQKVVYIKGTSLFGGVTIKSI